MDQNVYPLVRVWRVEDEHLILGVYAQHGDRSRLIEQRKLIGPTRPGYALRGGKDVYKASGKPRGHGKHLA